MTHEHDNSDLDMTFASDPDLSLVARGIYALLLTKDPESWSLSVDALRAEVPEGRTLISSGLAQLKQRGYVEHYQVRGKRHLEWRWRLNPKRHAEVA